MASMDMLPEGMIAGLIGDRAVKSIRKTCVCRNLVPNRKNEKVQCSGGGWWGDAVPLKCPKCGGKLTDLADTGVIAL